MGAMQFVRIRKQIINRKENRKLGKEDGGQQEEKTARMSIFTKAMETVTVFLGERGGIEHYAVLSMVTS